MKEFTELEVCSMSDEALLKEFLRRYAEENKEFKAKLEDDKHTLDGCMAYIRENAKKSFTFDGKAAMVWHTRVFGWAIAYYNSPVAEAKDKTKDKGKARTKVEKSSKTTKTTKTTEKPIKETPVIKMQPKEEKAKKEEKKPAKKVTKQIDDIYQLDLSLFD